MQITGKVGLLIKDVLFVIIPFLVILLSCEIEKYALKNVIEYTKADSIRGRKRQIGAAVTLRKLARYAISLSLSISLLKIKEDSVLRNVMVNIEASII